MSKGVSTEGAVRSTLLRLARESSGNAAVMFSLSGFVVLAAVGGAFDLARWFSIRDEMQAAIDAAVLAGGRALQVSPASDPSIVSDLTSQYFERIRPARAAGVTPTFTVQENATVVRGEIEFGAQSMFLAMVGISSIQTRLVGEAVIEAGANAGTNLELSLMLDTTGSVTGEKIRDVRLAAKDLVDMAVWSDQSEYTSKVALAPVSSRVNVGDYLESLTDVQGKRRFQGNNLKGITCVTERTGPEAFSDAKPTGSDMLGAYSGDAGAAAKANASNYSPSGACRTAGVPLRPIVPLTSDTRALKSAIDALPAGGSTAGGALGTAWAWYLLSPKWAGIWEGQSEPAAYRDLASKGPKGTAKLQKVAVLMTQGKYNAFGGVNYSDGSAMSQTISANAATLCANMKAAGIKIYTVGFNLGSDQRAIDALKGCASRHETDPPDSPSTFYSARSGAELRGAFRQIGLQLSTVRLRT